MNRDDRQEIWFFFLGLDSQPKEMVLKELAKFVFGSYSNFVSFAISSFSSTHEKSKSKRKTDEFGCSYVHRFGEALNENPHRVFFLEDLEQVDHFSIKVIVKIISWLN